MKVVLATGIYPPEIGGPATYVQSLAECLSSVGHDVVVLTYGAAEESEIWPVVAVPRWGGPLLRWRRYARALRKHGADADIVYAFSSISCGVPLKMSRLKKPKRILRLGGDFFWERATDRGYVTGLHEWYRYHTWSLPLMQWILKQFHYIVFSTRFQQKIYEEFYKQLPKTGIIENALPIGNPSLHEKHEPFRLLFMGRFVSFKNLDVLLTALVKLPGVRLTLVGSGPMEKWLRNKAEALMVQQRVTFLPPAHGEEKKQSLADYDMLILPSLTEISPHMALEARAAGLPVLLTQETGLSPNLTAGMTLAPLRDPIDIIRAVADAMSHYTDIAKAASQPLPERSWKNVCNEHLALFDQILRT